MNSETPNTGYVPHSPLSGTTCVGQTRILCVEDVLVNQELMRLCLEGAGFEVDVVSDGMAAVRAVTRRIYHLVFMDVQMPGMDGLEATRAIRALGGNFIDLPIIGLSANNIGDNHVAYRCAGMSAQIAKPFKSNALAACVRRWTGVRLSRPNTVLDTFTQQVGRASVRSLLEMLRVQIIGFRTLAADDADRVRRQAHALHGAASALGFPVLADASRALERASGADRGYLETLEAALAEARNALIEIDYELSISM